MNPNQDPNKDNPYDFIFNQNQPAQQPGSTAQKIGTNKTKQLVIFGGFLFLVLMVVAVVISIISSSGSQAGAELVSARAYQNEIERVIDLGNKNVGSSVLNKKITTISLVLATDKAALSSATTSIGAATSPALLAQHRSSVRDEALTDSLQVDRHDAVYEDMVDELVTQYYSALTEAEATTTGRSALASLAKAKANVDVIYLDTN